MRVLGYGGGAADPAMAAMIDDLLERSFVRMDIRCGWLSVDAIEIDPAARLFRCAGLQFNCGKIISRQLRGSIRLIFFACTLGKRFDRWSRDFFAQGDGLSGYVADGIGSVMVEAATDWLDEQLQREMSSAGLSCSNRFSPGYCGWDVRQQHTLFALLPDHFLDIELTPSALMLPIKSVSGVIGAGPGLRRLPYSCQLCSKQDCYMRKT